jgi:outer membrane protein TolC
MSKALEQYNSLASAIGLARENLRVRTRAFEEGLGTSLDVVDARLALSRVRLERLLAGYDYDVALAGLLEACGQAERFEQYQARGQSIETTEAGEQR